MNAKQKANELVLNFKGIVNGYVGSSMLTNTEYPETILSNAKICALKTVDEIRTELSKVHYRTDVIDILDYWQDVVNEIQLITVSE